ncbi:hypothetical protein ACWFMI_23050 [Nocardiopsis terrae]|uniref:hypothetical protein n=1 Tax=Streptomyces sp. NPDC057554 TaxID=3350538 RepID=UPI0036ABA28D
MAQDASPPDRVICNLAYYTDLRIAKIVALDSTREAGLRALQVGADLSSARVQRRLSDLHREAGRTPSEITHDLQEHITQALTP